MGSAPSKKEGKAEAKAEAPAVRKGPGPGDRKPRQRRGSVSAECPSEIPAWKKVTIEKTEDAKERIRNAVKENFLFKSLDEKQMVDIVDVMGVKKVEAGDVVITEGENGDFFYVIDEGEFEALVKDVVVLKYPGGGSFGELALMYNCPRAASVKCKSSGSLWTIDRESFRNIIMIANQKKAAMYEDFLKEVPILNNLTHSERSQIADNLNPMSFENGTTIIKQGDSDYQAMKFYLVVEGECQCFFIEEDGTRLEAGNVKRGGYFGEKALLEQSARAADVVACGRCETVSMDVAAFERLLGPCQDVMHRQMQSYKSVEATRIESLGNMKVAMDEYKQQMAQQAEGKSDAKEVEPADSKGVDLDAKAEAK